MQMTVSDEGLLLNSNILKLVPRQCEDGGIQADGLKCR